MTDDNARIHIAASDPAFPAKREAAFAAICAAITDITTRFGYSQSGTNWGRGTNAGRSVVNLQRSRYGWKCYVNLRFLTPDGTCPDTPDWNTGDDIRLSRFYLPADGPDHDGLIYLDVHNNPATLAQPMQILRQRAMPWLDAHHTGHPQIAEYLT